VTKPEEEKPNTAPKPRAWGDEAYLRKLGRRLVKLRVAANLSPDQLAKKAGVHRSFYRKCEAGVANPSTLILKAIATALKIPPGELLP
jgi:transcriptional regulator with XRE-family HTH domain